MNWIDEIDNYNFLGIYDVMLDIKTEINISPTNIVIPLLQHIVKFGQLFPVDSIVTRDEYCELRWKAVEFLKAKGIITSLKLLKGYHRWNHDIRITVDNDTFENALNKMNEEYRKRMEMEQEVREQVNPPEDAPLRQVELICDRFHLIARQLRHRHDGRSTLDVSDEFDVQDLLHALLQLFFDDIRPEEWTPSYAARASRMDFLLQNEEIVIEVKKTRPGLGAKEVGDQLIIDIERYRKHPSCKTLVCFVYDPEERIVNPRGLENDLNRKEEHLTVKVLITPKIH